MRSYRLRPRARNDLDRIWQHSFEKWGRAQARIYLGKIKDACYLIASNPHLGRLRDDILPGLHVFAVDKHVLCYFIDDNHVDVLRILHRRMDVGRRIF